MYCPTSNERAKRYFDMGQNFLDNKDIKKAINYFSLAVQEDSMFCDAWDNLGVALKRKGELGKATQAFFKSVKINKNDLPAYINWGNIELESSDYEYAFKLFTTATWIDSTNPEGYYGLAMAHYGGKHYEAADSAITLAIELYTKNGIPLGHEVYVTQGLIFFGKGDIDGSKKLLQREYDNFPELAHVNYYLGLCYLKGSNPDKELAKKYITKAQSKGYTVDKDILEQLK
jgi:tetratricopeptide (TPR) repeat protein